MPSDINKEFIREPSELKKEDLIPDRPTVGNDIPVILWRLTRIIGLHKILGDETAVTTYFIGKHIGKILGFKNIEELKNGLTDLKIGKLEFMIDNENIIQLSIKECVTCSGINPPLGKPICQFETGLLAGALESIYPEKKVIGEEIQCIGGLGNEHCLIECKII